MTAVTLKVQLQSFSVSSGIISNILNPNPDTGIDFILNLITESTSLVDVSVTTNDEIPHSYVTKLPPSPIPLIHPFEDKVKALEDDFSKFKQTNLFAEVVSSIPGIVDTYLANKMNEAVKTAVQLQSNKLRDEAQAKNEDFINKLDENINKIIKKQAKVQVKEQLSKILPRIKKLVNEQLEAEVLTRSSIKAKTSYAVAANLSELELKKIIIDKMKNKKSIHRSVQQKTLYKALIDAYETDKVTLETYGDTVTSGKELESSSALKEKTSKSTSSSKEGSKSKTRSTDMSTQAEEEVHTDKDLEEPTHQESKQALPLIPNSRGRRVIPFDHFINNDLTNLSGGVSSRTYATSEMKTKAVDYGRIKWIEDLGRKRQQFYRYAFNRESAHDVYSRNIIITIKKLTIIEWHNYKHVEWIIVRRDDDKMYTFKEGDYNRLRLQEIEDMLLFFVQGKLTNLNIEERLALGVSLRIFTRSIVIKRHVKDLQLGIKSYQKKLNLIKPDTYRSNLKRKTPYTTYSNPRGFIYQNQDKKNRLMRIDELHKFSDGTLNDVRSALDDTLKKIRMKYLPQTIWRELKFNSHKDAKILMEVIKKRFGRSTETNKVRKTLLKQQFENFTGSSSESLDQIHDRLRKLIIHLEIRKVSLSQEDVNLNTTESVSAAASVSAICAKMHVSSFPNVDSLNDFFRRHDEILKLMDLHLWVLICLKWSVITAIGRDILQGSVGSYDWSFQADEEPANYALMAFSFQVLLLIMRFQPSYGYHVVPPPNTGTFMPPKPDLVFNTAPTAIETDHPTFTIQISPTKPDHDLSLTNRPSAPIIEYWVSNSEDESETKAPQIVRSFVQSSEQVKYPRHSVQHVETSILTATLKPANLKPTSNVVTQSKPVPITAIRPVSSIVPKFKVTRPRHATPIVTKTNLPTSRHITRSPSPKASNSPLRVTAVKAPVVNAAQGFQGKWEWRPKCPILDHINPQHALKDKEVIYSRCSRHMIGNMSYLSDFEELNGGYVAFGGNPKGGKISGKGKIKTGKLDFDDVYFVKELKFNPFSVSQICDKKNSVLFTNTECLVLSPDFKLPDESQVLLRVYRENNMYNVNLKNIVPSGDLTCLFTKATIDESNLCHRRLGHINFKTINKLVKGNLVRGLPTNVFENDNTCVACKKGKQHKASCKTQPVSSVNQPLYRLHMNLFGPTFIKSLNKKSYYLVVTYDYSRLTWVFFLATKDETSPILKTFITGLENQLSLKVKVIRIDNGTEFKNNDLNQFCGMKGIKREYSVSRTPQQNGIAKRKNMTLTKAGRTMLNRVLVTKPHSKTPYELLHGRTLSIGFMRPFGCPVTILNTLDSLEKFDVAKIPVLDTRKFKQWQFRIQQYLQHEHYALWEVIEFSDSYKVPTNTDPNDTSRRRDDEQSGRTVTITTEDMQTKKNDWRFSKYKTAKELWAAILKTFGGNEATKKKKKNLLKRQYGNFKAEGSETLEQTFNILQVI
nr:putative ribonuclease H-like domain-containing protein [Tanacetum cinerariifolium]